MGIHRPMSRPTSGDTAWMALGIGVLTYDYWAIRSGRDTMTASFARALGDPNRRWATSLMWVYITSHLMGWIPKRHDPLGDLMYQVLRSESPR